MTYQEEIEMREEREGLRAMTNETEAQPCPSDIAVTIGAEVRRRNRVGADDEKGSIATSCELAATILVLEALRDGGFSLAPPQPAPQADLVEALKPFTTFAAEAVERGDAGWQWKALSRDRICDWFGPSDFGLLQHVTAAPRKTIPNYPEYDNARSK